MTDEEKIEEYVENILCKNFDNDGTSLFTEDEIKKAVLFGLAEGRKENEILSKRILEQQKTIGCLTDTIDELKVHCTSKGDKRKNASYVKMTLNERN